MMKSVVAVVALACMIGCGYAPRIYEVAVDQAQLNSLPKECYRANTIPNPRVSTTNYFGEYTWTVWDGAENKQYLDMGATAGWDLGDATGPGGVGASVGNLAPAGQIEGADRVFTAQQSTVRTPDTTSNTTWSVTRTIKVTYNDLGNTPTGTLDLSVKYDCTNQCTGNFEPAQNPSCAVALPFKARRVDGNQIMYQGGW